MKIINTEDFSSSLDTCCDSNYNKFNGAIYSTNTSTYIVWRAQSKPYLNLPTYPYITMSGAWGRYEEYCGILIVDNNTKTHIFRRYKHMSIYAAEDPRLYTKNGKDLYMSYTAHSECEFRKEGCSGLWELKINTDNNTFGIPKQICKSIISADKNESIYNHLDHPIYKNFSYVAGKESYLDGYEKNLELYKPLVNVKTCKTKKINSARQNNLKFFVQDSWKIALTTPTILHSDKLIGVAHIRIAWEDLSRNYDKLNDNVKGMLRKNDIHLNDTYFMSLYTIDCRGDCILDDATWSLSKPFMLTGNTLSDDYYSYDINFPCGIRMQNNNIKIAYGVGDCVFLESEISVDNFDFVNNIRFDYSDLEIHHLNLPIFEKRPIIEKLNRDATIKFLLPKRALLFDLGGSGLKVAEYTFSNGFSQYVNLGYWKQKTLPNLKDMLSGYNIDFDTYMHNGVYLLFSLAGTEKLWPDNMRMSNTVKRLREQNSNVYKLFNIPEHISVYTCGDNESHYYGNVKALSDITGLDVLGTKTILSIPVGTGINMRLTVNGTKITPGKYLWDYSYKGTGIRKSFINVNNISEVYALLKYIVKESYDFDIYSIDYIIFSGGTTRRMFNNFSKEEVNSDNVEIITKTNIYVNKDDLCPYKGLVYKLAYDKNILKQ